MTQRKHFSVKTLKVKDTNQFTLVTVFASNVSQKAKKEINSNKLFSFVVVFQFLGSYYRPWQPIKIQSTPQNYFQKITINYELIFNAIS